MITFSHRLHFSPAVAGLGCLAIAWLGYWNTLNNSFFFDDYGSIVQRVSIRDLWGSFSDVIGKYLMPSRSITNFSFALNFHFDGLHVRGYRVVNVVLHGLTGFFSLLLLEQIFKNFYQKDRSTPIPARVQWILYGAITVLLLHPIMTSLVNYVVQRYAQLATLFSLMSFYSYIQWRHSHTRPQVILFALLCIATYWMAIHSKQNAVVLPFIFIVYEICFNAKYAPNELVPFIKRAFGLMGIIGIIIILYAHHIGRLGANPELFHSWGAFDQFRTELRAFVYYWRLTLLPLPQWMNIDHDIRMSPHVDTWVMLSALFHLGILAISIQALRYQKILTTLGISWFYLSLSPYAFLPGEFLVDYKACMPALGVIFILTDVLLYLKSRATSSLEYYFPLLLLISLGLWGTWERNKCYRSKLSIWNDTVQKSPLKSRPYHNRGLAYFENKQYALALKDHNTSIHIYPKSYKVYLSRGQIYMKQKQYQKASLDFKKAIELEPNAFLAYRVLGGLYYELKQFDEAKEIFLKTIHLRSDDTLAYNDLGNVYMQFKDYEKALESYNKAITRDKRYINGYLSRGNLYRARKQYDLAAADYQTAITLDADNALIYANRGYLYALQNKWNLAEQNFEKAISLAPDNMMTYRIRAKTYVKRKEYRNAQNDYTTLIQSGQADSLDYFARANVFHKLNSYDAAIDDYSEAIRLTPNYLPPYFNRAGMYTFTRRYDEALADLNFIIQKNPEYARAYQGRSIVYQQLGERDKSAADQRRFKRLRYGNK